MLVRLTEITYGTISIVRAVLDAHALTAVTLPNKKSHGANVFTRSVPVPIEVCENAYSKIKKQSPRSTCIAAEANRGEEVRLATLSKTEEMLNRKATPSMYKTARLWRKRFQTSANG